LNAAGRASSAIMVSAISSDAEVANSSAGRHRSGTPGPRGPGVLSMIRRR